MSQIAISVIIPTYHRNDLLARCLDCLMPGVQTLPAEQYEVIVSDDGSETTAEKMIREGYPWAKWVAGPRKGPAANRNNAARYARGEFLVFTDDDCLPSTLWLAAFSSAIVPDIHVYEGKITCEAGIRSPLEHAPVNLTGGWLWSCNMMIQAHIFQELSGFDEGFPYPHMEDTDFRERLKALGYTFLFVENAVVDHPPRKVFWGNKFGAFQESLVYYWRRKEKKQFFKVELLKLVLRFRLKTILSYPLSLDSFKATILLIVELLYIISNLERWDKKYPALDDKHISVT